jgi:predicted kinase
MKTVKVKILRGIPASGKSTYSKELCKNGWVRINRDSLRKMYSADLIVDFNKSKENLIKELRWNCLELFVSNGKNTVIDDTNIDTSVIGETLKKCHQIAVKYKINVDVSIETLDIELDEALRRNSLREGEANVPKIAIEYFYNKMATSKHIYPDRESTLLTPFEKAINNYSGLRKAFIFDIDGTLALMNNRSPYDFKKVDTDLPNGSVPMIARMLKDNHDYFYDIIILSGRDDSCEDLTRKWLTDNNIRYDHLFMRKTEDNRPDDIVKHEIYKNKIEGNYTILGVFDDRNQVVNMWRQIGLQCFQVADGNF